HAPACGARVEHACDPAHAPAQRRRRGLELDVRRKVRGIFEMSIERMRHAEERNRVAGRTLQVGEVFHVRLSTAAAVEEFVDVEDSHLALPRRFATWLTGRAVP